MTDDDIITEVLAREGGAKFTNNPADRGGPTKFGITLAALASWRGLPLANVTAADVETMGEDEARLIYRARYIKGPGFDAIESPELRSVVVDCGVNHGPKNAIRMLQRALGAVEDDGWLGDLTLHVANESNGRVTALRVCAERARFFGRLISADHSQAIFAAGWMNRVADQIKALA